jgi:hypothetical protein
LKIPVQAADGAYANQTYGESLLDRNEFDLDQYGADGGNLR